MNIRPNIKLEPQHDIAVRFVELLTGARDTPMHFRFLPDDLAEKKRIADHEKAERVRTGNRQFCLRRNYDGTLEEVWPDLTECQKHGWGIFVVINEGGRNARSITKVRSLFVDGDGIPVPEAWEWHSQPDLVVKRDDLHWHAYWKTSDCRPEQFEQAQLRLAHYYKSDPSVSDLSRVMRVPGTLHCKHVNGEPDKLVILGEDA